MSSRSPNYLREELLEQLAHPRIVIIFLWGLTSHQQLGSVGVIQALPEEQDPRNVPR